MTMDVKDIGRRVLKDALSPIKLGTASRSKSTSAPSSTKPVEVSGQPAAIVPPMPSPVAAEVRKGLNEAISSLNVASEATAEISKYLTSIDGFIEQADTADSSQRKEALEAEANQLIEEIKKTAQTVARASASPSDEVRGEIERKLGRTLDALFPEEEASNAFGIGPISLSRKDSILETMTSIAEAKQRIEELRRSMKESGESLKGAMLSFEVAEANSESAKSSVRDVDAAAALASETQVNISQNPEAALNASKLGSSSLALLKG